MTDSSIIGQLYQRKMFRIGAGYLAVAWLLWQVVASTCPTFECSIGFSRTILWLLLGGFPITLAVAWVNWKTAIIVGIGFIAGVGVTVMIMGSQPIPVVPIVEEVESEGVLPNSVAVLLCDNLSPDEDDAYFAAGIHEEILNQLVKLSALNVIARTSVLQYADNPPPIPQIAEELNVGSVMECSVRFAGTSIMVTAQLIDPVTNSHLWSETYPGDISDLSGVFAMQADIAMNIANALNAEFSLEEQAAIESVPTNSPEAYRLYLQTKSLFGTGGIGSLERLDEAIALDPSFALAYAYKAYMASFIAGFELRPDLEQMAQENAEIALSLDSASVYALIALAEIYQLNLNKSEAEKYWNEAYALYPNDAALLIGYASFNRAAGEYSVAIDLIERAIRLDPNTANHWHQLGVAYFFAGQLQAARSSFQNTLAIDPDFSVSKMHLATIAAIQGDFEESKALLRPNEEFDLQQLESDVWRSANYALTYEMAGAPEDAQRVFEILRSAVSEDSSSGLELAIGYISIGENDSAYEEMKRAIDSGDRLSFNISEAIKTNRWQHPVLDEPRFVELRSQLGFQD